MKDLTSGKLDEAFNLTVHKLQGSTMKKYIFAFYTGCGIGEIWSHTIHPYYLYINATNEKEAIEKLIKSASRKCRYNDCFTSNKCAVEFENKIGVVFIDEKIIRWQGDDVILSPLVFGIMPSKTKISETKYIFEGNWVTRNVLNSSIFPTYESYMKYVYNYMNHEAFGESAEQRLNKYYYPFIDKKL
jgi:hypothetical protein